MRHVIVAAAGVAGAIAKLSDVCDDVKRSGRCAFTIVDQTFGTLYQFDLSSLCSQVGYQYIDYAHNHVRRTLVQAA
jgi:hypothetical protein